MTIDSESLISWPLRMELQVGSKICNGTMSIRQCRFWFKRTLEAQRRMPLLFQILKRVGTESEPGQSAAKIAILMDFTWQFPNATQKKLIDNFSRIRLPWNMKKFLSSFQFSAIRRFFSLNICIGSNHWKFQVRGFQIEWSCSGL